MNPKYPNIEVELTGTDSNAFAVMGRVCKALRRAGASDDTIQQFQKEATAGDYDDLLRTCMRWVECE